MDSERLERMERSIDKLADELHILHVTVASSMVTRKDLQSTRRFALTALLAAAGTAVGLVALIERVVVLT